MGSEQVKAGPSVLDVARISGVSPSTVCRVINNRSNVSEKAKAKVLEACESLGFKKNAAASMLRLRKSDAIACLMPDQTHEMFIDKVYSLKMAVRSLGRPWRMHTYDGDEEALRLLDEIVASRPAGAIVGCPVGESARRLFDSNDVAVVCYDCEDPLYDSVSLDRAAGVREAVAHLISQGRRKLLAFGFAKENPRFSGSVEAFVAAGLPSGSVIPFYPPATDRDLFKYGYEAMDAALSRFKFDSVMAINDAGAIGAVRRLAERGIRVPEDVSVVGFDDIMVSSFSNPAISTVSQPKEEMAARAIEFLSRRLVDSSLPRQAAVLSTRFVKRESA